MHQQSTIRCRVFYAIRNHDVELAEDFARRCPEVQTVSELNAFFHRLLSQYEADTRELRACLYDDVTLDLWLKTFETRILPVLRLWRLPPLTATHVEDYYISSYRDAKVG